MFKEMMQECTTEPEHNPTDEKVVEILSSLDDSNLQHSYHAEGKAHSHYSFGYTSGKELHLLEYLGISSSHHKFLEANLLKILCLLFTNCLDTHNANSLQFLRHEFATILQ